MTKPKIGVFGLTGCAGEQICILNCEDQLLDLIGAVDIKDFLTATTANDTECKLDVGFIEGAVMNMRDETVARKARERSAILVAIGTCAVWGGVAAIHRPESRDKLAEMVYGDKRKWYDIGPARRVADIVPVDFNISGCPMEETQFLAACANLLNGNLPVLPEYPVCTECKMKENSCLLVEKGILCAGPLTKAGCGARCPSHGVPCNGCHGPVDEANFDSAAKILAEKGFTTQDVGMRLRTFAADHSNW